MNIEIKNLSIYDGENPLLSGVNLSLKAGKITALVGKSGNGKSLLASALLGFAAENLRLSGEFSYGDKSLSEFKRSEILSVIMQNPRSAFDPLWTMKETAYETLSFTKIPKSNWKNRLENAFLKAGFKKPDEIYPLYPFEMSGGMLQRAMIALALLQNTPFLVADEPTTDLDLIVQSKILDILKELAREQNLGILLVTHDFGVVAKIADFVYVINNGKIVESGDVDAVFNLPKRNITKNLINAHLSLYGESL